MRILIVEDSSTYSELHKRYLDKAGYTTRHVATGEEALQVIDLEPVDIVLLDVSMAGLDGFETAKIIRETFTEKWIPIIFVTGDADQYRYKLALDAGGDDYLVKPVGETALTSKVAAMARILERQRKLHDVNATLKLHNQLDELTQLYNRRGLIDQGQQIWLDMQSLNADTSVLMIDIDHFKKFNDNFGHLKGDECLRTVAACLKRTVSAAGGLIGRFGGEEFICILANTNTHSSQKLGRQIIDDLDELAYPYPSAPKNQITVSIGCAGCSCVNRHTLDELIEHADALLYEAKNSGRDRLCWDDFPTSQQLLHDADEKIITANAKPAMEAVQNPRQTAAFASSVVVSILLSIGIIVNRGTAETGAPTLNTGQSSTPYKTFLDTTVESNTFVIPLSQEQQVASVIEQWKTAWIAKDNDLYFAFYHQDFIATNGLPRSLWQVEKAKRMASAGKVSIALQDLTISLSEQNSAALAVFDQHYHSNNITIFVRKTLELHFDKESKQWKIVRERFTVKS